MITQSSYKFTSSNTIQLNSFDMCLTIDFQGTLVKESKNSTNLCISPIFGTSMDIAHAFESYTFSLTMTLTILVL